MTNLKSKIQDKFIELYLTEGKNPSSVFSFCKTIKCTEADFYEIYSSFDAIKSDIWGHFINEVIQKLKTQPEWDTFSVRDKLLSFFYAYTEYLKANRSFVLLSYENMQKPLVAKKNPALEKAGDRFMGFAAELIIEGEENREIESRLIAQISQQYPRLLWMLHNGILEFWIKDKSKLFEKTDSLIEKSVNTTMDLMGKTPFDSLFDLGKFLFQNQK